MSRVLSGATPRSILEIGAGYGRIAHVLLSLYPAARYTVVDIEPAISISKWYLRTLFPDRDIAFVTPDEIDGIADDSVDLALSISSLQEMTTTQTETYIGLIDRVVRPGGAAYLKQWFSWYNPVDRIQVRFDDYPIPEKWVEVFKEAAPVQSTFIQAGWIL
jgi:putative sugar O-methyltransferase